MASVFFSKDVHNQLSLLKIETGLSIQELLIKALNLLFQAYNKPPIANKLTAPSQRTVGFPILEIPLTHGLDTL